MNQTETIDYKHGTTYAITVTALMTAVTCILAIIYPDWAGTDFTDKPGHIYFIISARMETWNYKLPHLPAYRTCRNPCIFRLHRWPS